MRTPLRIGTRGSQLALWQARTVAARLEAHGIAADLVIVRTSGDRLQEAPLAQVGGKRLFVKELEDALLRDEIDVAVHSAKDMPAVLPPGLDIAATLPREDARDVIVLPAGCPGGSVPAVLERLGARPRLGTSSIRRAAQLVPLLPGAEFAPVRGNVDTRLRKLDEGGYAALVLAAAGLRRLGLAERISASIPIADCIPAPGQGIIALEIREEAGDTRHAVRGLHDDGARRALDAERTVVAALGGGCHLPLGAFALVRDGRIDLRAVVCSPDGARSVRAQALGPAGDPQAIGQEVARQLADGGAGPLLEEARRREGPVEGSY